MLFTIDIFSLICTFIVHLSAMTMRVLLFPFAFVFKICVFVGKYSRVGSCTYKIAPIVINIYAFVEVRLELVINLSLIKSIYISTVPHFVDGDMASGRLVFKFRIMVHVD